MKITFDVECTPEEARRFLGLPDLSEVHQAYVEKMRGFVAEGASAEAMGEMVRGWSSMGEAGLAAWREALGKVGAQLGEQSGRK